MRPVEPSLTSVNAAMVQNRHKRAHEYRHPQFGRAHQRRTL